MKKFNFKKWVKAATVRAIKTMAQSAVALIGTSTLITEIDVKAVISAVILAGILSLLTSTAGLPEVSEEEEV
jgi:conserved domain protein